MKTFNKVKSVPWIIISTVFIILTLSCEIGLGPAVDTEPPRLEISTPKPDAVIRGDFKIGGNWSDDGTIESVVVTMKRTDGLGTSLEFAAEYKEGENDNLNVWSCLINPIATSSQLLDGNYIAQVDITDAGKHTTTKTVQFTIDNTPPVIVLQRPSTKADATQPDSYGQKFTLEGQAADDNSISQIELQVYSDKECTNLIHTVPLTNVPNSINLDVAEFAENVENVYSQIYGSTTKDGEKGFFCKIVAYDGAAYYPSDGNQTPEDLKGNSTYIYYLYEDIATSILSTTKLPEVYHILSGVYDLSSDSSRSTAVSSNTVKDNLAKNQLKVGSFTLNPENNPTFTVAGKEPLVRNEEGTIAFTGGDYDITNGSQIIMEVTPGLDSIPLDGNSLKIYFIECDDSGKAKSDATKVYPSTEVKKSGTTYKFTVSIAKVDGLIIGKNYLCSVEGYDEKKNSVVSSDSRGYGFHFTTSGAAPGLTITKPEEGSVTLSKGKTLLIEGTTTVEAGVPVITIVDNKETKKTITFTESQATEDEDKKLVYKFSAEIPFEDTSAYHELDIISDIEGIKTTRSKTVSYDCDAPVIKINAVSPIVEKSDENGQLDGKKYLNGEVQITFSLTDDFSFIDTTTNKPYFELWQNDVKKYTGSFTSTNSTVTETVKVDTKKLTDKADLEIKVFAWDRAGNKSEYSSAEDGIVYSIDQSTDKPSITPKSNINFALNSVGAINDKNNSANANKISAGSTVSFVITDDDGIEYIEVNLLSKDENGNIIKEELVSRYPNSGSSKETQTPYSFNLPSETGYYSYRLEVKDIITTNADDNNKKEYQFMIKATSPAPTIELQSAEVASENNSDINDGYIGVGGSFTNTITIKSTEAPFTVYRKASQEAKYGQPIAEELYDTKYEDKVSPTETTTYYYKVIDANGQTSNEKTIDCKVDTTAPEITPGALPGKQDTKATSFGFKGTASDSESGVKQISLTISDGANKSKLVTAVGTSNWIYQLTYDSDEWKEIFGSNEGEKKVTLEVVDNVGNVTKQEWGTFVYDKADPEIEVDKSSFRSFMTSDGLTIPVTVKDSYKLKKIEVTQKFTSDDASSSSESTKTKIINLESKDLKTITENIKIPFNESGESVTPDNGKYFYTFTVYDSVDNSTAISQLGPVSFDNEKPVIQITNPNNKTGKDAISSTSYKFEGTIDEDYLYGLYYQIIEKNDPAPNAPTYDNHDGWKEISVSGNSWSFYQIFSEGTNSSASADTFKEGSYDIYLYAIDKAANVSDECKTTFDVDLSAPTITKKLEATNTTDTNASIIYFNGDINLSITVDDTNGLQENPVEIKIDSKTYDVTKGEEENVVYTATVPETDFTEGKQKTIEITATDIVGKTTTETYIVCLDNTAPTIEVISPTKNESVITDTKQFRGNVSDTLSGVNAESVTYKLTRIYNGQNTEEEVHSGTISLTGESFNIQDFKLYKDANDIKEGTLYLYINAEDNLGTKAPESKITFYYDKGAPELDVMEITSPTNSSVKVEGKCWDSNEIEKLDIYIDSEETPRGTETFKDAKPTKEPDNNNFKFNFVTGSSNSKDSMYLKDGEHTIKIVAKDIAGNEKQETRTVLVDTVKPTGQFKTPTPAYIDKQDENKYWYNKTSIALTGTIEDTGAEKTSGIKSVKYRVKSNDDLDNGSDLNFTSTAWNGTITELEQGSNTVYIRITDNAGNYFDIQTTFYVDSEAPNAITVESVDGVQNSESVTINPEYEKLTNGKTAIEIIVSASDISTAEGDNTGLADGAITITRIGSYRTTITSKNESGKFQLTIPVYDKDSNPYTSGVVKATVKDNAGNVSSEIDLFTIKLDNKYPTVKIDTPLDADSTQTGTQVNKTITLTGMVSDDNGISNDSVSLEYSELNGTWTEWKSITEKYNNTVTVNDTVWTTTLDTTKFTDKSSIKLRAVATDIAGNTGNSGEKTDGSQYTNEIELKIDQNSDRPVITINNVTLTGMTSSKSIGFADKKIYGIVTDDDGLDSTSPLFISLDNGTTWKEVAVSNGSFTFELEDGKQTVLFKVKDFAKSEFVSSESEGNVLATPKLTDGTNQFGYENGSTALYLTIDTENPSVESVRFKLSSDATSDWSTAISSQKFGGDDAHNKFILEQTAGDINGIKSVKVDIASDSGDQEGAVYEYDATKSEDYTETNGIKYYSWKTGDIDVSKFVTGSRSVNVTVSDGIRETVTKLSINIDNTAPTLSVESHTENEQIRTTFLLKGIINDGDVGTTLEILPTESKDVPADWSEAKLLSGTTSMTWRAYFDGEADDEYTHLAKPKDLFVELYGKSCGITIDPSGAIVDKTTGNKYRTIQPFYFHFRVKDSLGNTNASYCFTLKVDPQGDIPVITQISPAENEKTQSGTIRFSGSAEDDKTIVGLYIEIDPQYDGTTFTPWSDTHTPPNGQAPSEIFGTGDYTNNPYEPITSKLNNVTTPSTIYGVYIGNSLSWNIAINKNGELNGVKNTGSNSISNNTVAVRFYAVDVNGNISEPTTPFVFEVDSDAPKIGSSVPFYLYQYNSDSSIKAAVEYTEGMWIKGKWYLVGSVEDESGIKTVKVDSNDIKNNCDSRKWSTTEGYITKYEVGNDAENAAGEISIELETTDADNKSSSKIFKFKYDNKAPELAKPGDEFYKITKKVQNENGFYTIKSSVTEANSGFERVVFYFKRTIDNYHYVYDSYLSKKDVANKLSYDGASPDVTYDASTGLYWKESRISEIHGATITLESENPNAHSGGIARIGETIYRIKSVNGKEVILEGNPSNDFKTIQFAIGHVVDHSGSESVGTKDSKVNGYYTDSPDDDGDNMIETVSTTGSRTIWSASVNSRNIPDGEIEIHYVAFDKAGNTAHGVVTTKNITDSSISVIDYESGKPVSIANNAPRLAGVRIWTDYNGNGKEDSGESETKYNREKTFQIADSSGNVEGTYKAREVTDLLIISGNNNDYSDSTSGSSFMTIRDTTKFYPELVGGNGALYYSYNIGTVDNFKNNSEYIMSGYEATPEEGKTTTLGKGKDQGEEYFALDTQETEYVNSYETTGGIEFNKSNFGNENGKISSNGLYWFEYVIYDSTEGCSDWNSASGGTEGRLSATMRIALNVDYFDQTPPTATIRPFYWNSKTDNSVAWDSTDTTKPLGHIELEGDLTSDIKNYTVGSTTLGEDPKVSGKIIARGEISDNIRLKQLYAKFIDHNGLSNYTEVAVYNNGNWVCNSGTGWSCLVSDAYVSNDGHVANWELTIDTNEVVGNAALDKALTIFAVDERGTGKTTIDEKEITGNTSYSSDKVQTTKNLPTAYYKMDIVPYVTGVKTSLSGLDRKTPSKFDRTALGHYPVRIVTKTQSGSTGDAETVTFEGFNLGSKTTLTVNELSTKEDSTTGGKSAKYVPNVNGIDAINNMNNNNAKGSYNGTINDESSYAEKNNYAYNRQPNNANNNLLTDDIIFDVWEFNSKAAEPISGKIEQPVMKINPTNGKIGFAFVNGPLYFSMGGSSTSQDYSYQYWMASYDFFTSVGFTYDDAGNSWGVAAGGDINEDHADKFQLMSSKWGLANKTKDGSYSASNSRRLESIGMKGTKIYTTDTTNYYDKQRIKSPSLATAVHDEKTNLYMAYYDAMNDELRFKAGKEYTNDNERLNLRGVICQILYADNLGEGGWSGVWIDKPTVTIQDGDYVIICDANGEPINNNSGKKVVYTLNGYYDNNSGKTAFNVKNGNNVQKPFPKGFGRNEYTSNDDNSLRYPKESVYVKIVQPDLCDFRDFDTEKAPYSYRNSTVNIVAGDGVQGYGAGEYVSLGVVPGTTAADDVVVITWYDTNARTLYYSYNTTPLTNRSGTYNAADGNTGWSKPVAVFSGKDYDYAGEYCKIAVDKNGGIHIAAYDPVNLDLVYAYASSYRDSFTTCVVDSNGVVGSNLTLDVALDNGKAVPFMGYYATSCIKPKYARFVGTSLTGNIDGSQDDEVTGKWEISVVPTSSIIEMQSNQHNDINIGVWKNSGAITNSTTGESSTNNQPSSYSSVSNGQIYGNGTKNPVLGYAIKCGSSSDTIETAQMK